MGDGGANSLNTVASDHELILLLCALDGAAFLHGNFPDDLLAEIVADLNSVGDLRAINLVTVDVDGEMSVHEFHLVLVTLGHTDHHVADVTADRANSRQLLLGAEPLLNLENEWSGAASNLNLS